jgi:hypothetical protein
MGRFIIGSSMKLLSAFTALLLVVLAGCGSGYKKIDGKWAFVTNNAAGYQVQTMDVDEDTFRILKSGEYAVDRNNVYHGIFILEDVDPASYVQFEDTDYSKDKNHAYFGDSVIVDADPETFVVLSYPYARDAKHIFIGCLRMNVESPDDFRVIENKSSRRSVMYLRSRSEVVAMFGDEFQDCNVRFDNQKPDERYTVKVPDAGQAMDGKWNYLGPRRAAKVK